MNVTERFFQYVSFDTQSDPTSKTVPSTAKQLVFANHLVQEMHEMGIENAHVDEHGIVYGWIDATKEGAPAIGWIAHMDTSCDMSGAAVKARIIEKYDGNPIVLHEEQSITMTTKMFPDLQRQIGKDLIVTDGTTLLGADDKAGIAEIMTAISNILAKQTEHGKICIAFTPDEEIGAGANHFDVSKFGADYAYTVDGGRVDSIDYENFYAAQASIKIHGTSIHPGSAKGKMRNALKMAMEFDTLLPVWEDPACTEGYEGFHHLITMQGACEEAEMEYIIRNHDKAIFERQKQDFIHAIAYMNQKYGANCFVCELVDHYANMKEVMQEHMEIVEQAKTAMHALGLQPKSEPIRGGTDGARLTFMGLPCPNLGTGGYNYHGKYEYAVIQEMETSVELIETIIANAAKG